MNIFSRPKRKYLSFAFIVKFSALFLVCLSYTLLVVSSLRPELPCADKPLCFYSNQTGQDLRLPIYKALRSAKESIHITMYSITDQKLISILHEKALQGIKVSVFFDPSSAVHHFKHPISSHPVVCKGLMHRKIIVVDDALVFLGSANMTPASISLHDNLTIGLYKPPLASFLTQKTPPCFFPFIINSQKAEVWLLPDPKKEALSKLLRLINEAESSIFIAMFTLTQPELVGSIVKAKKRGVDVKVVLDYYTGKGASKQAVQEFKKNGVKVSLSQGIQLLHHKWAYIDKKILVSGSTNWTKAAFTRNQDCLLILYDMPESQQKYLKKLSETILLECYD